MASHSGASRKSLAGGTSAATSKAVRAAAQLPHSDLLRLRVPKQQRLGAHAMPCYVEHSALLHCLGANNDGATLGRCKDKVDALFQCMEDARKEFTRASSRHKPTDNFHLLRIVRQLVPSSRS